MALYNYVAADARGRKITGKREASSPEELVNFLHEKNLVVVSVRENIGLRFRELLNLQIGGVPLKERLVFTKQLGTMLAAGLPLIQALEILVQQTENKALQRKLSNIYKDVASGNRLSEAFRKEKTMFNETQINLLIAGEDSGNLNELLLKIAEDLDKNKKLRGRLIGALIYPVILLLALVGVLAVMLIFMIPAVSNLYSEFGAESLPWITTLLISLSNFLTNPVGMISILAVIITAVVAFRYYRITPEGHYQTDKLLLKIPVFGNLVAKVQLAQFCRLLGLLLQSGVPIVTSLETIANALSNRVFSDLVRDAAIQVAKGNPLSTQLARVEGAFPMVLLKMLATGEETGKLDQVSTDMAKFYEQEVEEITSNLSKLMEPIILILVGGAVAVMALAIYLPIYQLGDLAV